jgi:hypothetical protein
MHFQSSFLSGARIRAAFTLASLLLAATAHAEFLRVTAANATGNSLYDITSFVPPGTINILNNDAASHGTFDAVVLVANQAAGTVDALVADAARGQIVRYTPAAGGGPVSSTLVWSITSGPGPAHPDGLSVDSAGNLYIVTSKLNDSTTNAVWVLPANANSATGYAAQPLLIDATFASANGVKSLQESVIATTTNPGVWNQGDLLVLVGNNSNSKSQNNTNDADVLVYSAISIAGVLGGGGPLTQPDHIILTPGQFPAGEYPTGMDFYPPDTLVPTRATLLVTTSAGRILRFDFIAGGAPTVRVFASGLGSNLNKVKVALQLGVASAYVTQGPVDKHSTGQILQFGAPTNGGKNNLLGSVTGAGVNNPDGLAVSTLAAGPASGCTNNASGCTFTEGVVLNDIIAPGAQPTGNVIENSCVVLSDPRWNPNTGTCDAVDLPVSSVCPGFGNESIPKTMCGGSGNSHTGFALIRGIANGVDNIPGILNNTQEAPDEILPRTDGTQNPPCPAALLAWAPRKDTGSNEGTVVEVDSAGNPELIDVTGYCDFSGGSVRGLSIYGIGFTLNASALSGGIPGYAQTKYGNLLATVQAATIRSDNNNNVKQALVTSLGQISSYLSQTDYPCAAAAVVNVDTLVASDANPASDYPGDANNPNPWGEIRGRLASLYMTINGYLIPNSTINAQWPPTAGVPVCPPPVVTLTATPTPPNIPPHGTATLTWTTQHALTCTPSGGNPGDGWTPAQGLNGNFTTPPLVATTTYALSCTGLGGTTPANVTVTVVPPPTIQFSASPSSVSSGGSATLQWTTTNAVSCAISGGGLNRNGLPPSSTGLKPAVSTGALKATTTYTMTCTNSVGVNAVAATTVQVSAHHDE